MDVSSDDDLIIASRADDPSPFLDNNNRNENVCVVHAPESDSDDLVVAQEFTSVAQRTRRRHRPRSVSSTAGKFWTYVCLLTTLQDSQYFITRAESLGESSLFDSVIGVALATWTLRSAYASCGVDS